MNLGRSVRPCDARASRPNRLASATAALVLPLGLCASPPASAQAAGSSVTIYGLVDACLVRADLGGGVKTNNLNSGCHNGSRLGFRGTEDLGSGLRAGFTLEQGFNVDNGTLGQGGRSFGRKALVSLSSPWGGVEMGRDYAPAFYAIVPVDPMLLGIGTASSTIWTGSASTTVARNDNAVNLLSPTWGKVSMRLQLAAGEGGTNGARKAQGLNALYRDDRTVVGLAHARVANVPGAAYDRATTLTAWHDWGRFTVSAMIQSGAFEGMRSAAAPSSASSIFSRDYRSYLIGGAVRAGEVGKVSTSLKRYDDRTAGNFDARQFSISYVHSLSRRTELYAGYSRLKNENGSTYSVSDATTAYTGVAAGAATSILATGIRHTF